MWNFWKVFLSNRHWSNRKISFVSILISTSIVFVLIMTSIFPFLSWPSLKISIGGLPIKITGFIFGPVVGGITGVLSDTLTFALRPTYFHWAYLLAFVSAGLIPGIIGYLMNRSWKKDKTFKEQLTTKVNRVNFFVTLGILLTILVSFVLIIVYAGDDIFDTQKLAQLSENERPLISNKWVFLSLALAGIFSMFIGLLIMAWRLKPQTMNIVLPIVAFSALLEISNVPLVSIGDIAVLHTQSRGGFITILTSHFVLSPIKIWVNLIVIFTAYKIISPLIYNKTANGWG